MKRKVSVLLLFTALAMLLFWQVPRILEKPIKQNQKIAAKGEHELSNEYGFEFSNILETTGITFRHHPTHDSARNYRPNHYTHGNGVLAADVNNDEMIDLYFINQIGRNELYINSGNRRFENITESSKTGLEDRIGVGGSFADIDNDGDQDLYIATVRGGNVLLENDGTGVFRDITRQSGLLYKGHSSASVFFDFDNDGLVDLLLINSGRFTTNHFDASGYYIGHERGMALHFSEKHTEKSILYKNLGSGRFKDVTKAFQMETYGWNGDVSIVDYNEDSFPDIYLADFRGNDLLLQNVEGQYFQEVTSDIFPKTSWGTMGIKFFDFNNDLFIDLMTTDMHSDMLPHSKDEKQKSPLELAPPFLKNIENNIMGNSFYKNLGHSVYEEISDTIGTETYWPWGISAGDIDADGYQDVFISSGMGYPYRYVKNVLLINTKGKEFRNAELEVGIEPRSAGNIIDEFFELDCSGADRDRTECTDGYNKRSNCVSNAVCYKDGFVTASKSSRSSVIFDLDNDGDLDIVTNEFGDFPQILISDLARKKPINFLKLKLIGTRSNRNAIGARVSVYYNGKRQVRYLDGKSGYLSQSQIPLYFGLGNINAVDKIEISWPSGATQMVEDNIKLNSLMVVTEDELPEPLVSSNSSEPPPSPSRAKPEGPFPHFTEVTHDAGIQFRHENGSKAGRMFMIEQWGSGVCVFDYDRDGWQDLLFVDSGRFPENVLKAKSSALMAEMEVLRSLGSDREDYSTLAIDRIKKSDFLKKSVEFQGLGIPALYRNNGNGTFIQIPKAAGLRNSSYGFGCAVGDYDNDGFDDVLFTGYGSVQLFKNEKGKIFRNVTVKAQISDKGFTTSAAWFDYNRDGFLDLFIGHYVRWRPEINLICGEDLTVFLKKGIKRYCGPWVYPQELPVLFRNNGDGTFSDVSKESGISIRGRNLGVALLDYNRDGWTDLMVANDLFSNLLLKNNQGEMFIDESLKLGISVGIFGGPEAGMGVDAADYNNNGEVGILVGNFNGEGLTLHRSIDHRVFRDSAELAGLKEPSLPYVIWATQFLDIDLDGWLDLFSVNGHIDEDSAKMFDEFVTYRQPPLVFRNKGDGTFAEVGKSAGLTDRFVGRGGAYIDFDGDGDLDLVMTELNGPARLYRNDGGNRNHWLRLVLEGTRSNRNAIGATVKLTSNGISQTRMVKSGSGYLGQSEFPITFGLGSASKADRVEILWPSGLVQELESVEVNRSLTIIEPDP